MNAKKGVITVHKFGVTLIEANKVSVSIRVLACYTAGVLSIRDKHVIINPGDLPTMTVPTEDSVILMFTRSERHHTPYISSVRKCALECLDPGFSLWYSTMHEKCHIAMLQNNHDGRFYCVVPGCKRSFSDLKEWCGHYRSIRIPKRFYRADFSGGQVCPIAAPLKENCVALGSIQDTIKNHGWQFKSLDDAKYGMHYSINLKNKLKKVLSFIR